MVALLLVMQLAALWLSLAYPSASLFCTGASRFVPTANPALSYVFGALHLVLGGLFVLGLASLRTVRLRPPYAMVVVLGMAMLPVQIVLVDARLLTCDMP